MGNISSIEGTLKEFELASLLSLMEIQQKSGILLLVRDADKREKARIFIREGVIVNATLESDYDLKQQEVIYYLLSWEEGNFHFISCKVDVPDEMNCSTIALVIEGVRRIDENHENHEEKLPTVQKLTSTT